MKLSFSIICQSDLLWKWAFSDSPGGHIILFFYSCNGRMIKQHKIKVKLRLPYCIFCVNFYLLLLLCCGALQKKKGKMLTKIPYARFLARVGSKEPLYNEPSAGGLTDSWQQIVSISKSNLATVYTAVTSPLLSGSSLDGLKQNHMCRNELSYL